jgi:hypothetical protein
VDFGITKVRWAITLERMEKKMFVKIALVTLAGLLLLGPFAHCQSTNQGFTPVAPVIHSFPRLVSWLNQPWAGDDTAYAALRKQIEESDSQGKLGGLISVYEAQYDAQPKKLAVEFRYFYALWYNRGRNDVKLDPRQANDMTIFIDAFDNLELPRTYNYTRLGAMCDNRWILAPSLFSFIQRLVNKDPDDLSAAMHRNDMLAASGKPALQLDAIQLANGLVAKYPDRPYIHSQQGFAYLERFLVTKDPAMAQSAIAGYRAYLDMAPPDGDFRHTAEFAISLIERRLAMK